MDSGRGNAHTHANTYRDSYTQTDTDIEASAIGKASPHASAAPRAPNQSMKLTAPLRGDFGMLATTPCHFSASS